VPPNAYSVQMGQREAGVKGAVASPSHALPRTRERARIGKKTA
jgi:hypothetical protein